MTVLHRLRQLTPLLIAGVFGLAMWLLWHELRQFRLRDIRDALYQLPPVSIALAVGLTALNYLALVGYDWLAIRAINHPLPLRRVALASFTGFTTSYNFGALLGGTSVRYRLYSAWGLSAIDIVQLVIMLGVTFWVGIFALAGIVFVIAPFPIPDKLLLVRNGEEAVCYRLAER